MSSQGSNGLVCLRAYDLDVFFFVAKRELFTTGQKKKTSNLLAAVIGKVALEFSGRRIPDPTRAVAGTNYEIGVR